MPGDPRIHTTVEDMPTAEIQPRARILVTDDEESVRRFVVFALEREGYEIETATTGTEALKALERGLFDVVLLDLNLPGAGGMEVLSAGRALQTDAQFVMLTGEVGAETAVEAMKLGAFDYICKPVGVDELAVTISRALRDTELRREVVQLRQQVAGRRVQMIGRSPALQRVHDLLKRVAPTRATVLITGETGTGKELVARSLHELSDRSRGPFVAINCSALPETLLESELFGYVKGAFTGAVAPRRGLFEEANGGTLFLDEIATISPAIQVKLLRVLQERRIQRLGSSQSVAVDFRLVAAGNLDLAGQVEAGTFREDLFYRLNIFPITVPPLRERKEDIPLLASHFRLRFAEENGLEPPEIRADTMERLLEHDWPGNVRELENFIERAVIMHAGTKSMPFDAPGTRRGDAASELATRSIRERWTLDRLEREYILDVVRETNGHQIRAAEILGIDRRTLYRKLKQYREEGVWGGEMMTA
jgi:two-component system NtrC family response regulator/two-component system response regulator HydG